MTSRLDRTTPLCNEQACSTQDPRVISASRKHEVQALGFPIACSRLTQAWESDSLRRVKALIQEREPSMLAADANLPPANRRNLNGVLQAGAI